MVTTSSIPIVYPESDGLPMADNTVQFEWIVYIKKGLDWLFSDSPDVFIASHLLWYPIAGDSKQRQVADIMVVFGRPKASRGNYQQWLEDDIPPQVVFEVISPADTIPEMTRKFRFYNLHGVEEYYIYDPDRASLGGFIRQDAELEEVEVMEGWVSPCLEVGFGLSQDGRLELVRPNGQPFETYEQMAARAEQERLRAEDAEAEAEKALAKVAQQHDEIQRLRSRLKALGADPDDLSPG